jgi:hypothetical protein|tara:strand:- start:1 stop:198 length:198 start_codon:yes stop_codon:yes gene_type:complete
MRTEVEMCGKQIILRCCAIPDFFVEENHPAEGPLVYYLCKSHREEILPFCNQKSAIKIFPIAPIW